MESGAIPNEKLISHEFGLEDWDKAFELDQRAYLNRMLRLETEPALANATFCALPA